MASQRMLRPEPNAIHYMETVCMAPSPDTLIYNLNLPTVNFTDVMIFYLIG